MNVKVLEELLKVNIWSLFSIAPTTVTKEDLQTSCKTSQQDAFLTAKSKSHRMKRDVFHRSMGRHEQKPFKNDKHSLTTRHVRDDVKDVEFPAWAKKESVSYPCRRQMRVDVRYAASSTEGRNIFLKYLKRCYARSKPEVLYACRQAAMDKSYKANNDGKSNAFRHVVPDKFTTPRARRVPEMELLD